MQRYLNSNPDAQDAADIREQLLELERSLKLH
jgi:regulator of sirC expression with transglutaminase-like and TPR domain